MRLPPRLHPVLHQPRAIWGHPGDESSPERWAMTWRTTHPGLGAGGSLIVCGLHPSTRNNSKLDPTLARIKRVGFELGYEQVCVINLYPLRCTTTQGVWAAVPADFDSYGYIERLCCVVVALHLPEPWTVVAAWGASAPSGRWRAQHHARHTSRCAEYLRALGGGQLGCWGTTKSGHPRHPLYLSATAQLQPWRAP